MPIKKSMLRLPPQETQQVVNLEDVEQVTIPEKPKSVVFDSQASIDGTSKVGFYFDNLDDEEEEEEESHKKDVIKRKMSRKMSRAEERKREKLMSGTWNVSFDTVMTDDEKVEKKDEKDKKKGKKVKKKKKVVDDNRDSIISFMEPTEEFKSEIVEVVEEKKKKKKKKGKSKGKKKVEIVFEDIEEEMEEEIDFDLDFTQFEVETIEVSEFIEEEELKQIKTASSKKKKRAKSRSKTRAKSRTKSKAKHKKKKKKEVKSEIKVDASKESSLRGLYDEILTAAKALGSLDTFKSSEKSKKRSKSRKLRSGTTLKSKSSSKLFKQASQILSGTASPSGTSFKSTISSDSDDHSSVSRFSVYSAYSETSSDSGSEDPSKRSHRAKKLKRLSRSSSGWLRHRKTKVRKSRKRVSGSVEDEEVAVIEPVNLESLKSIDSELFWPGDIIDLDTLDEEEYIRKKKKKKHKKKKEKTAQVPTRLLSKQQLKQKEDQAIAKKLKAQQLLAEAKQRAREKREQYLASEKAAFLENETRLSQLQVAANYFDKARLATLRVLRYEKLEDEWERYLVCKGLPDVWSIPEMNTYLHLWNEELKNVTSDQCLQRTNEAFLLLKDLQNFIDEPLDFPENVQKDWLWIRSMFRDYQINNINLATYNLLKSIDRNMERVNLGTSEFKSENDLYKMNLWLQYPLPTPTLRKHFIPAPVSLSFPELNLDLVLPKNLKLRKVAIRGLYLYYDHLTDTSKTFPDPEVPAIYKKSLREMMANEYYARQRYKYDNRIKSKLKPSVRVSESGQLSLIYPDPEPEVPPGVLPPFVRYRKLEPSPSNFVLNLESQAIEAFHQRTKVNYLTENDEINLRYCNIIGGIYFIDLLTLPRQAQELVSFEMYITDELIDCGMQLVPFHINYTAPPPLNLKQGQQSFQEELDARRMKLNQLIFVTVKLPTHVYYLKTPIPCQWNYEKKCWSTRDIHHVNYNEQDKTVTFKTGRFGPLAFAVFRYPNFPYKSWEVKPLEDGSIHFQLKCAVLIITFNIKRHRICISDIQNAPNECMDEHLKVYYRLPVLIRLMRAKGIELFPSLDITEHVNGLKEKHYILERHTYYSLAASCSFYSFAWSRWNATLDYRQIVLRMRLVRSDKNDTHFETVLITPYSATIVNCNENSEQFDSTPIEENMKFYADLFHLVRGISNMKTKVKLMSSSLPLVDTVAKLFVAVRFLSFC